MVSGRKRASNFKLYTGTTRRASFLSMKMKSLFDKTVNERGSRIEKEVKKALEVLKEENKIASFYFTKKWSREDRKGIDAVVFLLDGTEVKLQIKSSLTGVEKHKKQQQMFKEEIPVVYGNYLPGETFDDYKERIWKEISKEQEF